MTSQYTQPTTTATTVTPEITDDYIGITRWRMGIQTTTSRVTTISPTFGVDWGVQKTGNSESRNYIKNTVINIATRVQPKENFLTTTKCDALITLPLEREPCGKLLYLQCADSVTTSANGVTMDKGSNVNLIFDINGFRLDLLTVKLELTNLLGTNLLTKVISYDQVFHYRPLIEDPVTKVQNWIGEIFLTPQETLFTGTATYLELKYRLIIGNRTTRNYVVETGRLNFK
jgi:hypothetical protein